MSLGWLRAEALKMEEKKCVMGDCREEVWYVKLQRDLETKCDAEGFAVFGAISVGAGRWYFGIYMFHLFFSYGAVVLTASIMPEVIQDWLSTLWPLL